MYRIYMLYITHYILDNRYNNSQGTAFKFRIRTHGTPVDVLNISSAGDISGSIGYFSTAGDGNNPILHVKDTADTFERRLLR